MSRSKEHVTGLVTDPKQLKKLISDVESQLDSIWPGWCKKEPFHLIQIKDKQLVKQLLYQYKNLMISKKYIRKQDMLIATGRSGRVFVQGIRKDPQIRLVRVSKPKKEIS